MGRRHYVSSLLGDFLPSCKDLKRKLKYMKREGSGMELGPRQIAFVKSEMENIENDDTRLPTERVEAGRIREEVETELTE